jgi:hypothetical protein
MNIKKIGNLGQSKRTYMQDEKVNTAQAIGIYPAAVVPM